MSDDLTSLREAQERVDQRFVTAQNNPDKPTEQDLLSVAKITAVVKQLALEIEVRVPGGRDKSLALTHLEDVLTRASRGIYIKHPVGGTK